MTTSPIEQKHAGRYSFICWGWREAGRWGHEVRLLDRGREVARSRIRYYNRTWEQYRFQTAMMDAVERFKNNNIKITLAAKREQFGGRLPRGVKYTTEKIIDTDETIQGLRDYVNGHADTVAYKLLMAGA